MFCKAFFNVKIKLQKSKLPQRDNASLSHGAGKSKIKYSCRRQRGITDAGLKLFGGRFLDCAAMLSKESTAAALEMTRGDAQRSK
jgi:hypothetical protein